MSLTSLNSVSIQRRDVFCGYDALMENVSDPSHVDFAHHKAMDIEDLEVGTGDNLDYEVRESGKNMELEVESCENVHLHLGSDGGGKRVESNFNCSDVIYNPQVALELKPKKGQEFQTLDDVKNFYNAYAKEAGFSVRNWSTKKRVGSDEIVRKEYVCFKQGKGSIVSDIETTKRRGSIKEGCNAKLAVVKSHSDTFIVSMFVEGHSHPLTTPRKIHLLRSHRNVSSAQKCSTQQLDMINVPPQQQFSFLGVQVGGFENIGCTQKHLYNHERERCNEIKGHDGEMLHEYLKLEQGKNPAFTFKIEVDDEQRITHCFWADEISRRAYKFYSDVVIFDTTYNTNRYGLIFASLMGFDNHGQTIIFACAFLGDESRDSFVWLFNQFLEVMSGDPPKMIITDQDPAMTKAISQTLPSTFHRYCSWHILRKFYEKIDSMRYSAYYKEFSDCIWKSEAKEEFDSKWMELIEMSGLNDNKWLRSIYEIRSRWVPAYVNHVFSAEMSSSQQAESSHAFFKKYVSKNNSLVDFMIQFGRRLVCQRHEELMADHKDMTEKPQVKMLHHFLVQMVDIYTREMFYKFQDELWDSLIYKFELVKEGDNDRVYKIQRKNGDKNKVREILYEKNLDFASCSCKKFESSGILCRHMLAYLHKMHDFEKLPSQYILKRWTKTAKSATIINEGGMEITDKSYLLKRSRLIQFSLDVVDKALTSEEATKVYIDALGSALEKINKIVGRDLGVPVDVEKSNQIFGCGTSVVVSGKMSCNYEHSYNEPRQAKAKGCGKGLRRGKEKTLRKAKKSKAGCDKVGQSHYKRNRSSSCNEDGTQGGSSSDDSYSSTGISL